MSKRISVFLSDEDLRLINVALRVVVELGCDPQEQRDLENLIARVDENIETFKE